MTYDPTAVYRTAQVTTSSPAARVVLLYEGAIRFAALSVQRLEQRDIEGSHNASLRAQSIVGALRESLDLSAGDIALRLDSLYEFMIRRLAAGNVAKDPKPTREVIELLRDLLTAWRAVADPSQPSAPAARPLSAAPASVPSMYRATLSGAA